MRELTKSEALLVAGNGAEAGPEDTGIGVTIFGGGAGLVPPPVCGPAGGPANGVLAGPANPDDPAYA